jgi:EAL domain-containing protein (putative c-di-GMP-specific phosphodiesterase class I)
MVIFVPDRRYAQAIVTLARGLQLEVVAEGVEKEAQLDILLRLGCELGQGSSSARLSRPTSWRNWRVDRQSAQVAQRRVAGPEVVNGDAETQRLELGQEVGHYGAVEPPPNPGGPGVSECRCRTAGRVGPERRP